MTYEMAKVSVSIPQGTRDFGSEVIRKRDYIFSTIRNVFELYGFEPLETPAMENLETLMGKYGEEGDKLIFKILNNGLDNPDKEKQVKADLEKLLQGKTVKGITERALKYDLTIPFARYVAMNHHQLVFPFKRYQVQPVWRAERPQKGRYREFYQCDADVVGSHSLLNETELATMYKAVFEKLNIPVEIKINSRKFLTSLSKRCGESVRITDFTIAIDKMEKIGLEKVKEELSQKGLNKEQVSIIEKYLLISGNNQEKIIQIKEVLGNDEECQKGIADIEFVLNHLTPNISIVTPGEAEGLPPATSIVTPSAAEGLQLTLDPSLARGLNYYTGIIFEVKAKGVQMGSIGGGGRYDDLTGLFGVPNIPGVGISFGVDRIYDVMEELNLFPMHVQVGTQVLFFNLGDQESRKAFEWLQQLRQKGIRSELYHEFAKFEKQFKYAEKKKIPWIIIIGDKELKENTCTVKNLAFGGQQTIPAGELINFPF